MNRRTFAPAVAAVLLASFVAVPAFAGDKGGEGSKFYMEYKAAFAKAKTIEEILPYMAKSRVAQVESTPKEDRAKMFGMIKMMDVKDVKISKETKTDSGYTLEATGKGGLADGPTTGTITLVREDGKLKIDKESWKN